MAKFVKPEQSLFGGYWAYYGLSKYQIKSMLRTNGWQPSEFNYEDADESQIYEHPEDIAGTFARMFKHGDTYGLHVKMDTPEKYWKIREE